MNIFVFSLYSLYRSVKLDIFDRKRILRLQALIEKGSIGKAKEYLQLLLKQTKIDRYIMAYYLIIGYYKNPQTYNCYLEDFIRKTGSSCGHGKYNSEYSPIYWLGFINGKSFEFRFILDTFCFLESSVSLEFEIKQKLCAHSFKDINYSKLPDSDPNCFRYSLHIPIRKFRNANHQIHFSLITKNNCNIKIYHCTNKGARNLILQENLNISLTETRNSIPPSLLKIGVLQNPRCPTVF